MKYILKKEYPGSPKLGNIIDNLENDWIENYPEFWELVVEKDYEIVSILLQRSDKHQIHNVSEYKNTDYIEALLNCNGNKIHSVKRLSDSEIFTIGDKVIGYNNSITKIKTIDLVGEVSLNIGTDKHEGFSLKNLKKAKQPLFTTEDGVDIYNYLESFYWIRKDTLKLCERMTLNTSHSVFFKYEPDKELYFSTKEKAEEYILMNKPCLSLSDVWDNLKVKDQKEVLKFVKSKLNK